MIEKLRDIFVAETLERLNAIETSISNTCYTNVSKEIVADVFTAAHNIKGTAPMVGVNGLTDIVLPLERVYSAVNKGDLLLSKDIIDSTKKIIPVIKAGLTNDEIKNESQAETESVLIFFESLL